VHPDLAWPRSSRTPARHPEAVMIPPLPSPPVHHSLPTEHQIPCSFSETGPLSRDSASHRHHLPIPWTQLTVSPRTAAHGTQWRPSPVHHRPTRSVSINTREPSLEASLSLICSLLSSHSPAEPRHRLAEKEPPPESSSYGGRSSPTRVEVAVDPAIPLLHLSGLRTPFRRVDLTLLSFDPGMA
jgi:hypothetical protein